MIYEFHTKQIVLSLVHVVFHAWIMLAEFKHSPYSLYYYLYIGIVNISLIQYQWWRLLLFQCFDD